MLLAGLGILGAGLLIKSCSGDDPDGYSAPDRSGGVGKSTDHIAGVGTKICIAYERGGQKMVCDLPRFGLSGWWLSDQQKARAIAQIRGE